MKNRVVLSQADFVALRFKVFDRDGWECRWCGKRRDLTVHHILARSGGGGDVEENLITLCNACHEFVQRRWRRFVDYLKSLVEDRILRRDGGGGGG